MSETLNKGNKMIRRKAAIAETAEQGWCLGWYLKNEEMLALFESALDQKVTIQSITNIKFMDGNPETILVFE